MKKWWLIALFAFAAPLLSAQGLYLEPGFRYAHHLPLPIYADYPVYGADLRLGWQTDGSEAWEKFFNYPLVGIDFRFEHHTMKDYFDEESQSYFGRSYADSPDIDGQVFFDGPGREGEMQRVVIDDTDDGLLFGHTEEE